MLDAPHLFDRPATFLGPDGRDWPDNAQRFAALARAAADIGLGVATSFAPDVVHAHDWQAALAAAYLHYAGTARPATVVTIHNLAFQGHFPAGLLGALGLPPQSLDIDGVEYFGGIGFLKAGLRLADRITTVSPTYAREIMTPEHGMALDGLLRSRAAVVEGIVNGIDVEVWNPETDVHLPFPTTPRASTGAPTTASRCASGWTSARARRGRCSASSPAFRARRGSTSC